MMTAKKIGILTFHRCINYGSFWQTYCLMKYLQDLGHQVEVLDHQSSLIDFKEWKCALQPVLPAHVSATDRALYRKKVEKFLLSFESLSLSRPFPLDEPIMMDYYDLVIVGSDEVWNLTHPWYGNSPVFYGEGIRAKKIISYAASFGNFEASWGLHPWWKEKLHNFDAISVRDDNSGRIIRDALGISPELVLDPCLAFPQEAEARDLKQLSKPYLAVYGHNFSEIFKQQVSTWARKNEMRTLSLGYRNDWADEQWIVADPHDFAGFMKNASAVATNFFHGCVFAFSNNKPFICERSEYRSNKVEGLMWTLKASRHLISEASDAELINSLLTAPPEEASRNTIAKMQESSRAFLAKAISTEKFSKHEAPVQS